MKDKTSPAAICFGDEIPEYKKQQMAEHERNRRRKTSKESQNLLSLLRLDGR